MWTSFKINKLTQDIRLKIQRRTFPSTFSFRLGVTNKPKMNSEPVVNESEFTKVTFFSSHSKKVKDRLKFSYLIGGLLDDISELEQNVGKQLMKAFEGSRLSQFEKLVSLIIMKCIIYQLSLLNI